MSEINHGYVKLFKITVAIVAVSTVAVTVAALEITEVINLF